MPGPMAAWARSTGAMLPFCKFRSASGNSRFNAARKSRRDATPASLGRGRHTRTLEDASEFRPASRKPPGCSVRIGHVPSTEKPLLVKASSIVSQPVEVTEPGASPASDSSSLSCCLKA
jgi:hypothetical protein